MHRVEDHLGEKVTKLPSQFGELKILLVGTVGVIDEDGSGASAVEVLEFLFARELTESEEKYVLTEISRVTQCSLQELKSHHSDKKRQNTFEKYSEIETRIRTDSDDFPTGEMLLLTTLTKAFTELRTGTGKPAKEDPLKVLILCALRSAHEEGHYGLNSLELMELFLGRELTEEEEEYLVLETDTPIGHA
jgi:hypothetical protein